MNAFAKGILELAAVGAAVSGLFALRDAISDATGMERGEVGAWGLLVLFVIGGVASMWWEKRQKERDKRTLERFRRWLSDEEQEGSKR